MAGGILRVVREGGLESGGRESRHSLDLATCSDGSVGSLNRRLLDRHGLHVLMQVSFARVIFREGVEVGRESLGRVHREAYFKFPRYRVASQVHYKLFHVVKSPLHMCDHLLA